MNKILTLEDNDDIRDNLEEICELQGYSFDSSSNGRIGIKKACAYNPDLILCDSGIPEINGSAVFDVLKNFLQENKTPFSFLTASAKERKSAKGQNLGEDGYITKPYEPEVLLTSLEQLLIKMTLKKKYVILKTKNQLLWKTKNYSELFLKKQH